MYYVYVSRSIRPYWKGFDNRISALLFKKINGYSLIAKGKDNARYSKRMGRTR